MSATPFSNDSNENFADPDAMIPGVPPAVPAQLPPSSSLTSEHIQLHPSPADIAGTAAKLSIHDTSTQGSYSQPSSARSANGTNPYAAGPPFPGVAPLNGSSSSLNAAAPQQAPAVTTTTTTTTVSAAPVADAHASTHAATHAASSSSHPPVAPSAVPAVTSAVPQQQTTRQVSSGAAPPAPPSGAGAGAGAPVSSSSTGPSATSGAASASAGGAAVEGAGTVSTLKSNILRRKLTSFVGFSNLPQQWHQKSIREGFDLNLLVIGESGLGKSTLLNTLFEVPVHDLDAPHSYESGEGSSSGSGSSSSNGGVAISTTKIELNESGVKLRLSVVDTPGYGDHINNLESWKSISDEIDARFDQYLEGEESLSAGAGSAAGAAGSVKDPRIHACLFFIDPTGHSLKPLDVVVMKKLHQKVNIVPIIAKADTQTEEELVEFKKLVLAELRAQEIRLFEPPSYDFDDEETVSELMDLKARVPFAVVGSTNLVVNRNGHSVLGREYPWGVVEVMNEDHNDFVKLRSLLIRNHMEDLHESTNKLYEAYRTEKMVKLGVKQDDSVFDQPDPAVRQEEERQQHEQRLAKMEAEMRAVFQQKVTEKETKLKSSENELFQKHREIKEQLDQQRQELEQRKQQLQAQIESRSRKSIR